MTALADRVATPVERADFDDLVTLVSQAPPWEKDRSAGVRILLRAVGEGKALAPDQILARWTWRLARATRKVQDRRASSEYPEAKRLLGALANSRGHRHEENAQKLVRMAKEQPIQVGAALLASAEGYTPRATKLLEEAREELGEIREVALALSENLPAPKQQASRNRRRRRRKKKPTDGATVATETAANETTDTPGEDGGEEKPKHPRRRRRKPAAEGEPGAEGEPKPKPAPKRKPRAKKPPADAGATPDAKPETVAD